MGLSVAPSNEPIQVVQTNYEPPPSQQDVAVKNVTATTDIFSFGQVLADKVAPDGGGELTFSFSLTVQTVGIYMQTADPTAQGRVNPFPNGFIGPSFGIPLDAGVPQVFPVQSQVIKVWAPAGARLTCWAFGYGMN